MIPKKILLVEGTDDEHVIKAICGRRGLQKIDEIKPCGGIDRLLEAFPVRLKESDVTALGVVIDADSDLQGRWESLRHLLVQAGYENVCATPLAAGVIIDPPANSLLPRAGLWLMPNNSTAGILEDFLRFLVPTPSPLLQHAEQSLTTIPATELRFTPLARPKALIHTWLAWQQEPGRPLGLSITARFLDGGAPQVDIFVRWLQSLFGV